MTATLADTSCAALPLDALARLGPFRARPDLRAVLPAGTDRVWLHWPAGDEKLAGHLLSLRDTVLFVRRDGLWYRLGRHLPSFDVPAADQGVPLASLLVPSAVQTKKAEPLAGTRRPLRLVRNDQPRPATALRCTLKALAAWADLATGHELARLRGLWSGSDVVLLGERLPPLAGAERFWGEQVRAPLGFRVDPPLPQAVLARVLGLRADELALVTADGAEVFSGPLFAPLSRAGIRLALREVRP